MTAEEKAKKVVESFRYGGLRKGTIVTLVVDGKVVKTEKVK